MRDKFRDYSIGQIDAALKATAYLFDGRTIVIGMSRESQLSKALAIVHAAITRFSPPGSAYSHEASQVNQQLPGVDVDPMRHRLDRLRGILLGIRHDIQNDCFVPVQEIVRAEVFSDFLEMSEHLLDEGYKDAAAVIVGSVLENHLRKLCMANGIPIENGAAAGNARPKKADVLNADLAKARVYEGIQQKQTTAWLGIRNSAAHGKYSEYDAHEVKLMLQGVRQLVIKLPA